MAVRTKVILRVEAEETYPTLGADASTSRLRHLIEYSEVFENGTGASQQDFVFSVTTTASTGGTDYDFSGGTTSVLNGAANAYVEITGIYLVNKSTTAAEDIKVGGDAASVLFLSVATANGAAGAGGIFAASSPIAGWTVTNSSADILQIASASGTPTYELVVTGRSIAA